MSIGSENVTNTLRNEASAVALTTVGGVTSAVTVSLALSLSASPSGLVTTKKYVSSSLLAKRSNFSSVVSAPVMPPPLVMGDSTPNLAEDEAHPFSSKLINVPSSAFSVASVRVSPSTWSKL